MDYTYLFLAIAPIILVLGAQFYINATYNRFRKVPNKKNITGHDVAQKILDYNKINDVRVEAVDGNLSDHFDPRSNVVRLSEGDKASIASIAVASHEIGHVIQHKTGYIPIKVRSFLVPICNLASNLGYIVIVIGFMAEIFNIVLIGIILIAVTLIFQLITLPVEFNASRRAVNELIRLNVIDRDEVSDVKSMLNAAAMTYVASFLAGLLQILRLLYSNRER